MYFQPISSALISLSLCEPDRIGGDAIPGVNSANDRWRCGLLLHLSWPCWSIRCTSCWCTCTWSTSGRCHLSLLAACEWPTKHADALLLGLWIPLVSVGVSHRTGSLARHQQDSRHTLPIRIFAVAASLSVTFAVTASHSIPRVAAKVIPFPALPQKSFPLPRCRQSPFPKFPLPGCMHLHSFGCAHRFNKHFSRTVRDIRLSLLFLS